MIQNRDFSRRAVHLAFLLFFLFPGLCFPQEEKHFKTDFNNFMPGEKWYPSDAEVDIWAKKKKNSNFDESKVPYYNLPNLFESKKGKRIKSSHAWEKRRRNEILYLFQSELYGFAPPVPEDIHFEAVKLDTGALEGKATFKKVSAYIHIQDHTYTFHIYLFLPNRGGRYPVFLLLNHRSTKNTDPTRSIKSEFWPVEYVIGRGYAIAAINIASEVEPDKKNAERGIRKFYEKYYPNSDELTWGAIAAWAWAGSRGIDYLIEDPGIDTDRIAIIGHSRSGKAALWAGAQDDRISLTCSNCAGQGGPALSRRRYGETIQQITNRFPYWFSAKYKEYAGKEDEMPFDQHMLISLVAPRGYHGSNTTKDLWADPRGTWLAQVAASKAWELYNFESLKENEMPVINGLLVKGPLSYHIREGEHNLNLFDWKMYLDHADILFNK